MTRATANASALAPRLAKGGRFAPKREGDEARSMTSTSFAYRRSPDQDATTPARHPVVVIGAGPVGLTLAIDLARRGVRVVLLDDADRIGEGSRAICFAKKTLEILGRHGIAGRMVEKGVTWRLGKVFHQDERIYAFDLLPEGGHAMPAFVNIQQYYVEAYLVEAAAALPNLDLRWRNKVTGLDVGGEGARLTIATPDGPYAIEARYVVACDGSRSPTRAMLGLDFAGEVFEDRFLIADVKMTAEFPTERWFWFEPPFHDGQSALLHRQPDDVWRIDLQLGWGADAEREKTPDVVVPRIARMLGHADFTLEWVSVYTFQCRRLARFTHGPVIFAGDSAHQVSPFGARGANSGVQDADNLGWKLALVIKGEAPESLLASYDVERGAAADENILNSTRSTDFIAPRGAAEKRFRDAVLSLARAAPFARRMVNSGRLSLPSTYDTALSTPDREAWAGPMRSGAPMLDAALRRPNGDETFLLAALSDDFTLLVVGEPPAGLPPGLAVLRAGVDVIDADGLFAARYDATPGAAYLVRPDAHLAARWRRPSGADVIAALERAMGRSTPIAEAAAA
jgi:3-(3-hydroxy-phenyl)propionate hydroxylase